MRLTSICLLLLTRWNLNISQIQLSVEENTQVNEHFIILCLVLYWLFKVFLVLRLEIVRSCFLGPPWSVNLESEMGNALDTLWQSKMYAAQKFVRCSSKGLPIPASFLFIPSPISNLGAPSEAQNFPARLTLPFSYAPPFPVPNHRSFFLKLSSTEIIRNSLKNKH